MNSSFSYYLHKPVKKTIKLQGYISLILWIIFDTCTCSCKYPRSFYIFRFCYICLFADALAIEVRLVSVSRSVNPSKHEVSLLLDNKFVVVLSMAKNSAADVIVCFDIKNTLTTNDNTQLGLVTEVRRCHKFFFILLSNGTVCILFIKSIVCLTEVYASHWYMYFGLTYM